MQCISCLSFVCVCTENNGEIGHLAVESHHCARHQCVVAFCVQQAVFIKTPPGVDPGFWSGGPAEFGPQGGGP